MAKCYKCGREYLSMHVKNSPQPKQGCPYCDKRENKENKQKFLQDMMNRTQNKSEEQDDK